MQNTCRLFENNDKSNLSYNFLTATASFQKDSRSNPEQFPKRFWRGIFDGIWWAIVTMATVG